MADCRHFQYHYEVITPLWTVWFGWNLVRRCRLSCRWWWCKGENQNQR